MTTSPLSLVHQQHATAVAECTEKLARLEARYPDMSPAPVHRVNLAMLLISRLSWYGYEIVPPVTNAVKMALWQELSEAMEQFSEWYRHHGGDIQASARANMAQAVKEGRLR